MSLSTIQEAFGGKLPTDYNEYIYAPENQGKTLTLGVDVVQFWDTPKLLTDTSTARAEGILTDRDVFIGALKGTDLRLFYRYNEISRRYLIYDLDGRNEVSFHAFDLNDYFCADEIFSVLTAIDEEHYRPDLLNSIRHCPDGLHAVAYELYTLPAYEEEALALYRQLAAIGHPESAAEIADHYEHKDQQEDVHAWRTRAMELGNYRNQYELAEFLLEYRPEETDRAMTLLQDLVNKRAHRAIAAWRLSKIYLQEKGPYRDYEKGLHYINISAEHGNYYALADLAYCYYTGKGVQQSTQTAYNLLKEAEGHAIAETGSSNWTTWMDQMTVELVTYKA